MADLDPQSTLREIAQSEDWHDQLAALTDDERVEAFLAEADGLRGGDDADRAVALVAYAALHRGIDPSSLRGCARASWTLDALRASWALDVLRAGDARFLPLLDATQATAADRLVRLRSRIAYGAHLAQAGLNAEAERMFVSVLKETRGGAELPERAAVLNLCRLYRTESRQFEAFVLARHAVRLFEAAGNTARVVLSLEVVLGCLGAMSEWDEFDAVMQQSRSLLADMTHPHLTWWEEDLDILQFDAHCARGRAVEAFRWLDERAVRGPKWPAHASRDERWGLERRARVLCDTGALDEASAAIAALRTLPPFEPRSPFRLLLLDALCRAQRGDRESAREATTKALSIPLPEIIAVCGTGLTLTWFVDLANALRDAGDDESARRCFDHAAVCAIERMRQTEVAIRVLPELGDVAAHDQAILARTRLRFASEHRELLRSLADLFERAAATGRSVFAAFQTGEFARVCAWCARVQIDGEWVPIGHYLPLDGALPLTHGMCPDCGAGERTQLRAS